METIIVENVTMWRQNTSILQDVSWRVNAGEHWAVLGPNGSGKTSLVMAVAGYTKFGLGRIFLLDGWLGRINLTQQRERIGMVGNTLAEQLLKATPRITALQVVLTGANGSLWPHGEFSAETTQKAHYHLNVVGFGTLADAQFRNLSTGERQACMLARTRMGQPELVILDEACAGLDLGARERFLQAFEGMISAENGPQNSIFITHHPEEIVPSVTHVLLIRDGQVIAQGKKADMLTSQWLSATFDLAVKVTESNRRYWVQAATN